MGGLPSSRQAIPSTQSTGMRRAVEFPGYPVVRLRPIEGLEFVEETVTALGYSMELAHHLFRECWAIGTGSDVDLCRAYSMELAHHLFRECWAIGTGSDVDLCRAFGWNDREVESHKFKVAMAADTLRLLPRDRGRRTGVSERGSAARTCKSTIHPAPLGSRRREGPSNRRNKCCSCCSRTCEDGLIVAASPIAIVPVDYPTKAHEA
jgi:hypothetical protein